MTETQPATRSYLADGRVVTWLPPAASHYRWAIDAELATQPVPPALGRRTGITAPEAFWPRWTVAEVTCKLLDVPIVEWLHRYGLDADVPAELSIVTFRHHELTVSIGRR
jgi:hypothetical protein